MPLALSPRPLRPVPEVPGHKQDTYTLLTLCFWGSALSLLTAESTEKVLVV